MSIIVMGNGGAVAVLLMVFMAITSAMYSHLPSFPGPLLTSSRSSETVATTALLTYNVYQAYIHPSATTKQLKRFSEYSAVAFAIVAASIACGFNHAGFSVGFLITAIGIFVDSAIVPSACTIMWKKQSKAAVIISPLLSSCAAMVAWFLKAHQEYGEITVASLSGNLPLVAGNMMSLCGPLLLTPLITFIRPDDYDWNLLHDAIRPEVEDETTDINRPEGGPSGTSTPPKIESPTIKSAVEPSAQDSKNSILLRSRTRAIVASIALTLCFLILWPVPMYASKYVFSKGFFVGWTIVVFLWAFFASSTITLIPIWEGRKAIVSVTKSIFGRKKDDRTAKSDTIYGVPTDTAEPESQMGRKEADWTEAKH